MRVTSLNGVPMHGDYKPRLHDADCAYLAQLHLPDRTLIWFPVHRRRASSGQRPCHPQPGDPRGLIRTTKPGHAVVQLCDASNGASVGVPPHMLLHHPQLHHADWKDALVRIPESRSRCHVHDYSSHSHYAGMCERRDAVTSHAVPTSAWGSRIQANEQCKDKGWRRAKPLLCAGEHLHRPSSLCNAAPHATSHSSVCPETPPPLLVAPSASAQHVFGL